MSDAGTMRAVPLEEGPVQIVNAADLERRPGGIVPRRLPAWTRHQITDVPMDVLVGMPGSVRLRFRTDARRIGLDVKITHVRGTDDELVPTSFDLVDERGGRVRVATDRGDVIVIGDTLDDIDFLPGDPDTLVFDTVGDPGTMTTYELWLTHRAVVELQGLSVDRDAAVTAAGSDPRRRWLHYGSSISQCSEVDGPTDTWPVIAAGEAGVAVRNLGFAGNAMLDPYVARTIRDLPADVISLALGINVIGADAMRERTFAPAVHGFLDTVRDGHPHTPIAVVTPIFCPSLEDHPGPSILGPDGRFTTVGGCEEVRVGSLTLVQTRRILADIVAVRRDHGDEHLHLIDGLELFGADEAADLPDDLHPNPAGYTRIGHRFARLVFGSDGPFGGPG